MALKTLQKEDRKRSSFSDDISVTFARKLLHQSILNENLNNDDEEDSVFPSHIQIPNVSNLQTPRRVTRLSTATPLTMHKSFNRLSMRSAHNPSESESDSPTNLNVLHLEPSEKHADLDAVGATLGSSCSQKSDDPDATAVPSISFDDTEAQPNQQLSEFPNVNAIESESSKNCLIS